MSFKEFIKVEYRIYKRYKTKEKIKNFILHTHENSIWKYVYFLRKEEYYDRKKLKLLRSLYRRKKIY